MRSLRHYKSRALVSPVSLAEVPVKEVAANIKAVKSLVNKVIPNGGLTAGPEYDALWFYLKNHVMSVIAQRVDVDEPLGKYEPLVADYHESMQPRALRMFYYLLLICTREVRHLNNSQTCCPNISKLTLPVVGTYIRTLVGMSESGAVGHLEATPVDAPLGYYVRGLEYAFFNGNWSGGFGGKAWGAVAKVLRQFVMGEISAEIMLDTAFTLCHNNGPIFNKGMLFGGYSAEIRRILDVQRGGQIPQLVRERMYSKGYICEAMSKYESQADQILDGGLTPTKYVDWYLVEACGAIYKYSSEKKAQVNTYGASPMAKKADAAAAAAVIKAKAAALAKAKQEQADAEAAEITKAEAMKGVIEIMPNVYVTKIQRATQ